MRHEAIPCTSVARTLLDLAAVGRRGTIERALEQSEVLGVFDLLAIEDVLERHAGHRGCRRLRLAVAELAGERPVLRSEFERLFLPIASSAGMPTPLVNHVLNLPDGPMEVDLYWPTLRLVVELDGYEFHNRPREFREDRRRDRRLAAVGIHCLRYVWDDMKDPGAIRRELVAVAATRG